MKKGINFFLSLITCICVCGLVFLCYLLYDEVSASNFSTVKNNFSDKINAFSAEMRSSFVENESFGVFDGNGNRHLSVVLNYAPDQGFEGVPWPIRERKDVMDRGEQVLFSKFDVKNWPESASFHLFGGVLAETAVLVEGKTDDDIKEPSFINLIKGKTNEKAYKAKSISVPYEMIVDESTVAQGEMIVGRVEVSGTKFGLNLKPKSFMKLCSGGRSQDGWFFVSYSMCARSQFFPRIILPVAPMDGSANGWAKLNKGQIPASIPVRDFTRNNVAAANMRDITVAFMDSRDPQVYLNWVYSSDGGVGRNPIFLWLLIAFLGLFLVLPIIVFIIIMFIASIGKSRLAKDHTNRAQMEKHASTWLKYFTKKSKSYTLVRCDDYSELLDIQKNKVEVEEMGTKTPEKKAKKGKKEKEKAEKAPKKEKKAKKSKESPMDLPEKPEKAEKSLPPPPESVKIETDALSDAPPLPKKHKKHEKRK